MICGFIDQMRARGFRVESICRVLTEHGVQVAPRTYRNWKAAPPSDRTVTDAALTDALRATVGTPESMYGRRKMTAYLRRQGHRVAGCTVDRLMRDEGLSGVVRGRKHRTTIPGKEARRAPDLLDRDFTAAAPNCKWVTDFTYCRTWSGFVYVAFVVDCFSRAIVGWHAASVKDTSMVTTALKMALWRRDHAQRSIGDGLVHRDGLVHHSDAGSQGGFNWSSQHLDDGGVRWFVVSKQQTVQSAQSSGRRGIRSISVMSRWPSGNRSPQGFSPRRPRPLSAWRRRSEHAGSTTLAACHHLI
ncbi:IS3 family transposase [Mycolicibacterium sp. 120266]|uniref:IS3 family transposase n=1 Tax=Mycolicibacterium sp. 120266 TaxID=3090601 RepID=UPI00299E506C|nr:IS3 family transposase [Mycolicibacterium sp. 120266]MDX1876183.1 IS3 family transposase [Mycolicibacterium sp. 120266]